MQQLKICFTILLTRSEPNGGAVEVLHDLQQDFAWVADHADCSVVVPLFTLFFCLKSVCLVTVSIVGTILCIPRLYGTEQ